MIWLLIIPVAAVAIIGLLCVNFKLGFMVSDATAHTGFDAGFYMMTIIGLTAAEVCFAIWLAMVLS